MNEIATTALLQAHLRELNLTNMARHLDTHLRQAHEGGMSHAEFLHTLTALELETRGTNREKRRIKEARFPLIKPLELFDFEATPSLDRRVLHTLVGGEYLSEHRNVILL